MSCIDLDGSRTGRLDPTSLSYPSYPARGLVYVRCGMPGVARSIVDIGRPMLCDPCTVHSTPTRVGVGKAFSNQDY